MKPRIRIDPWSGKGWICRSREEGGYLSTHHAVIGFGETMAEAYAVWQHRRDTHPARKP